MSAQGIIERLQVDGWAEIQRMVDEREPESVHLDFKLIEGGMSTPLSDADLGNIAKGVSAFANVEGGVLVLGVRAKGGGKQPDRADGIALLDNADAAKQQLERFLTTLTDPPVPGLRVLALPDPVQAPKGVLAVYAPQSEGGPHQAARGDGKARYFIRTSTNSEPAPHSILSGLFARRPSPKLGLSVRMSFDRQIVLYVFNEGRGLAENIMLRLSLLTTGNAQILSASPTTGPFWRRWEGNVLAMDHYPLILTHEQVIHSDDSSPAYHFSQQGYEHGVKLRARIDARGMRPVFVNEKCIQPSIDRVERLLTVSV